MSLEWFRKLDFWKSEAFKKVVRGTLIAAGGAALTYLGEWVLTVDFGTWTPVVTALSSVLINAAKVLKK